jgi:hypothetical protein
VWKEKFLVRPAGNRTSDLSLMRRVWYHKTTASALKNGYSYNRGVDFDAPVKNEKLLSEKENVDNQNIKPVKYRLLLLMFKINYLIDDLDYRLLYNQSTF